MDGDRFDGLTRRWAAGVSRRTLVLRLSGVGIATLLPVALATRLAPPLAAKKKGKKCKGTKCQGDCFSQKGAVCCPGGGACASGQTCCPPAPSFPDGGCAAAGRTCCHDKACAAGETCCAPSASAPGGACVPQGTACPA